MDIGVDGLVKRDRPLPMPLTISGDCGVVMLERATGRDVDVLSSSSSLDPV